MRLPAYSRSHIFRHSRLWSVVTSMIVAGAVVACAGNSALTPPLSAALTSDLSHESDPAAGPNFSVPVTDIDASTVQSFKPTFRSGPVLQELPEPQVMVPEQGLAPRPKSPPAPGKSGSLSRREIDAMAKELYNAFAASDAQRAQAALDLPPEEPVLFVVDEEPVLRAVVATTIVSDASVSQETLPVTESVVAGEQIETAAVQVSEEATLVAANSALVGEVQVVSESADAVAAPPTISQNVTINLINRLVKKGLLSQEDADELIRQAYEDARVMQERSVAMENAIYQTQVAVAQAAPPPPASEDSVRVTYVPEVVKKQIKSEIKDDLVAQAKTENWGLSKHLPPWVEKLNPFADIRVRLEGDFFPSGNDNTGAFPNFNAINTGAPFDVAGNQFSPQINADQDRFRIRLRARAGIAFDLGENFSGGLRLATGESNSPVSQNQSLGLAYQGQGGNFSKYAIWLDRAFIKYELGEAKKNASLTVGRFDNPFFTVSEIMWDNDIGFDGFALQAEYEVFKNFTPFISGGAFPVYNTDFNFSSNQPAKFPSHDKWLYAGQLGFKWAAHKDVDVKFGTAYYYFQNVEGELSSPFTPQSINDAGDTDATRPSFAQKGNTYMALRNIVPDASNDFGTINQWQYFGLATPYQNLVLTGRIDYKRFEPVTISLFGEYARNLAYNQSLINAVAVNNRGPSDDDLSDTVGSYAGGANAWIVGVQVGQPEMVKRWDWNLSFGYRYVESDAVIDGFNDSDFGGGGTNLKGYTIAGHLALAANVWIGIRWMSAESIAGPPYKEDIIQFDINSRF